MNEEETQEEVQDSETPEEEQTSENQEESVETPEEDPQKEVVNKELKSLQAQKDHFREKAERAESERKKLEAQLNKVTEGKVQPSLDVEDYIEMSSSLSGLDPREQEYIVKEHKLSGTSLKEIRESEDFQLWDSAYRMKKEKEEKALKPSSTQAEAQAQKGFVDRFDEANKDEQEEMLIKAGLYKPPRQNPHPRVSME